MSDRLKRNLELESAIEKDPDNVDAYLVYGDWLQARGDPRGELIVVQCAAYQARPEDSWRFDGLSYALLEKHQEEFLGGLVTLHEVRWRCGFIHKVKLTGYTADLDDRTLTLTEFLRQFLSLPMARFLRCLEVEPPSEAGPAFHRIIHALNRVVFPTVERLTLGDPSLFNSRSAHRLGNLGNLQLSRISLPRLRSLTLVGRVGRLEHLDLPELRELTIFSGMNPRALARCLADIRLPKLERLVIEGHGDAPGSHREGEELQGLFELPGLPHLKHLGLRRLGSSSESRRSLCRILSRSDLLRRLETLDLSLNSMTDEVAQVLVDHAGAFKHLRRLEFSGYQLSAQMAARVAALCGKG